MKKTADVCLRDALTAYKYKFLQKVEMGMEKRRSLQAQKTWLGSVHDFTKIKSMKIESHKTTANTKTTATNNIPVRPQNVHIKPLVVKATEYRHSRNAQTLLAK